MWTTINFKVLGISTQTITEYEDSFGILHSEQSYVQREGRLHGCVIYKSVPTRNKVDVVYTFLDVVFKDGTTDILRCQGRNAPVNVGDEIGVKVCDYKKGTRFVIEAEKLRQGNLTRQNMINDFIQR